MPTIETPITIAQVLVSTPIDFSSGRYGLVQRLTDAVGSGIRLPPGAALHVWPETDTDFAIVTSNVIGETWTITGNRGQVGPFAAPRVLAIGVTGICSFAVAPSKIGQDLDYGYYGIKSNGVWDDTPGYVDMHDELMGKYGGGIVLLNYGVNVIGHWQRHPAISVKGRAKQVSTVLCKPGTNTACMHILAVVAGNGTPTIQWNPEDTGYTMKGNAANMGGVPVKAIWYEPSSLSDSDNADSASLSAGFLYDLEISGFTDNQLVVDRGRHRFRCDAVRSTNAAGGSCIIINGLDPAVTNSGFGGGTKHTVVLASISGALWDVTNNVWGCQSNRSDDGLALHAVGLNGGVIGGVFNDTIEIVGTNPAIGRPVVLSGFDFRPADEAFDSNGVPWGIASGAASAQTDTFIRLNKAARVSIGKGNVCRTGQNNYSYNKFAKAYSGSHVVADTDLFSAPWAGEPNGDINNPTYYPPWNDGTEDPYFADSTSVIVTKRGDAYNGGWRLSGCTGVGLPSNQVVDPNYALMVGPKPASFAGPIVYGGPDITPKSPARRIVTYVSGNPHVMVSSDRLAVILAAGGLAALTFVTPASGTLIDGMTFAIRVTIAIAAVTWTFGSGGGQAFVTAAPTSIAAGTTLRLLWVGSPNGQIGWYII